MQHGGAVEDPIVHHERQTHDGQTRKLGGTLGNKLLQRRDRAALQDRLMKQVGAGVAGQGQLGEDEDVDALALGLPHQGAGCAGR